MTKHEIDQFVAETIKALIETTIHLILAAPIVLLVVILYYKFHN